MQKYLIIPVYNTMILPDTELTLRVQDFSKAQNERVRTDQGTAVIGILKNPASRSQLQSSDFYGAGVMVRIDGTAMTSEGRILRACAMSKVTLLDLSRVQISTTESYWEASVAENALQRDLSEEQERRQFDALIESTEKILKQISDGRVTKKELEAVHTINEYGNLMGPYLGFSPEDKYALLLTDSQAERFRLLQEQVARLAFQKEAHEKENQTGSYKAMEADDYRRKIEESGMPGEARREVDRVLERYAKAQPNDPERSTLENYLDFVTALKWTVDEAPPVDLKAAREVLNRDHYGLDKVKERILQQIAVMTLKKNQAGSILLLVGAPGTGKTSMGKAVAEALGRKYSRISLGGVRDEAEIRGHRRTYIGAMPGRIMEGIKRAGSMNPVVVLDEIDKLSNGYNGDPQSALLEVLDPEQNATFTDHYMNIPYDLSNVFFICTANSLQTIPGPLLDRMEVIQVSGYTASEKLEIAKRHLLPRARKDAGIGEEMLSVSEEALEKIIEEYTMEAGVRGLKKQLDILCRHSAADIVENGAQAISVTPGDVSKYLGNHRITHDKILEKAIPGVVTGLAWTQVGGEILFIETKAMHGSGQIILTGQMGDVMKESATISASLVKSLFMKEKLDFKENDIHIHIPSGATPKDGPSAGITLFTALTSLVTGKAVSRELAMTGEISLRGQVLPIGGLPEKLMAADRAGVKTVLIPQANMQDLEDVPQETRDHLSIVPVKTIADVLREALDMEMPDVCQPEQGLLSDSAK